MNALTKGLLGLLCACLFVLGVYFKGYSDSDQKHLQEATQAALFFRQKQEEEREQSQKVMADISQQWQAHIAQKSTLAQGTINRLRNDGIRLSVELADARLCAVTGSRGPVPNGRAELSDNTSRFLIEQAQRADAQVSGLQGAIRELQGGQHGTK